MQECRGVSLELHGIFLPLMLMPMLMLKLMIVIAAHLLLAQMKPLAAGTRLFFLFIN